jgi:hypothetical protein
LNETQNNCCFFRAQVSTQIETQTKGNKGLLFRAGRAWVYIVQAAIKNHIIKRNGTVDNQNVLFRENEDVGAS